MKKENVYKWSFIDRISIAVLNFGVNIALARMLCADDFGLLAMVAIFIAIASDLSSCGLSDGLIHKSEPTELDYSTVFVFNLGIGLVFASAFFFGAPFIAGYFGHEELTTVMRMAGLCFVFQSMSYVQETRLRKQMRMRSMCFVRVGATITVGTLGILAAYLGYGYKALIITQICLSFFFFVYYTIATRWFPKIQFSIKAFKEFFNYGVHLMLAYLGSIVGRNINTFVLGRFYSSSMSGIYYQGAKLAVVPFSICEGTLNYPFFAVASNEADPGKVRVLIKNMLATIVSVNGVFMMLMLVGAAPCIEFLYGDKWLAAIPVFRVLAVAEFLVCVRAYMQTICKVYARTTFIRNMGFAEVAIQLSLLAIFYSYGIIWIAWTQAMGFAISLCIYTFYCRRLTGLTLGSILSIYARSIWLQVLAAIACLGVLYLLPDASAFVQCVLLLGVYAGVIIGVGEATKASAYMSLRQRILKR